MTQHIVLVSSLNLRESSSSEPTSLIKAVAPKFAIVTELSATPDKQWLQVKFAHQIGWMHNDYLLPLTMYTSYPWVKRAAGEFGVAETPGNDDNPRIVEYQRSVVPSTKAGDAPAWCSCFANWCIEPLGYSTQPQIDPSARSWNHWGTNADIRPGAIIVFWRRPGVDENSNEIDWPSIELKTKGSKGHVGFFVEKIGGDLLVLGGNQGNRVSKHKYPENGNDYGFLSARWPIAS